MHSIVESSQVTYVSRRRRLVSSTASCGTGLVAVARAGHDAPIQSSDAVERAVEAILASASKPAVSGSAAYSFERATQSGFAQEAIPSQLHFGRALDICK